MDAAHFRQRAARARELAQSGDDIRLSRMLLEVALDLDAEAEAMEAGSIRDRRSFPRVRPTEVYEALLHTFGPQRDPRLIQVIDLSVSGAKFHIDRPLLPGTRVTLVLPSHALGIEGTILRVRGTEAAMVFDPAASAEAALNRQLAIRDIDGSISDRRQGDERQAPPHALPPSGSCSTAFKQLP